MKKWMLIMLSLLLLMTAGCGKEDTPDLPATITPGALLENSDNDTVKDTTQLSPDGDTAEDGEDTAAPVTENKDAADEDKKEEKPSEEENAHKGEDTEAGNDTDEEKEEDKTPANDADVLAGGPRHGKPPRGSFEQHRHDH